MALTDENSMVMPVSPMGNGGFGNFGGDGWWIIILLLIFGGGGWGNGFGGSGMNGMYPWMNQSNQISDGFRDQMLGNQLSGIQTGLGDITGALAGTTAAVVGAQNAITQQLYTNQIADMERSFAAQTAATAGVSGLQAQLANCCCENRAGIADLRYTVATENCADRAALADGIRDIIAATQAQTQVILDRMCQQEIDALKARNSELQTQVAMQNLAASQTAQTAALVADNTAQTQYLINRIAPYPVPAYTVTNPNTPAV